MGTWTLMGNDPAVAGPGLNQPARVNVGGLVIKPGEQYGIALRCNNCANRYTNGTAGLFPPGNVFTNGELEIHLSLIHISWTARRPAGGAVTRKAGDPIIGSPAHGGAARDDRARAALKERSVASLPRRARRP